MLRNARDCFIRFGGRDIREVLPHPSTETDPRLADVFRVFAAAACLEIDAFLVESSRVN